MLMKVDGVCVSIVLGKRLGRWRHSFVLTDARFSAEFDKASGYRTKAVLAVAVRDPDGNIVAILQAINKQVS